MIVYKDYITFQVLGQEINLISSETEYGHNTVAEMTDKYYFLGNEAPNIAAAILAWQKVNSRDLTEQELHQVLVDNGLTSAAI